MRKLIYDYLQAKSASTQHVMGLRIARGESWMLDRPLEG